MKRAACLALASVAIGWALLAPPTVAERERQPCATEDSAGPCHWDASERGNRQGRTFTVHADQSVTYP